jgi:hypothetical protein
VPFTVQLRDEDGNVLDAFALRRLPVHVIPAPDDVNSPVLRFVNPFGDTILNRAQAAALLGELQAAAVDDPDVESYRRLVEITGRCATLRSPIAVSWQRGAGASSLRPDRSQRVRLRQAVERGDRLTGAARASAGRSGA